MTASTTTIVWFRQDLRLHDNPALAAAAARGAVIPLYILDDANPGPAWRLGGASRWWLHHSLAALRERLGALVLLRGDPRELVPRLAADAAADAVVWNRCYEPYAITRDTEVKASLSNAGIAVESFNGSLLFEPWEIRTAAGGPFKVYTPFRRAGLGRDIPAPLPAVKRIEIAPSGDIGDRLDDWHLVPQHPNWAAGWEKIWRPGEAGAWERLDAFVQKGLGRYKEFRDRPDRDNVSRLSPHLHFGEVSPRSLWMKIAIAAGQAVNRQSAEKFQSELCWREFSYHLLYHFPKLAEDNWRGEFDAYPWRDADADLVAWQHGRTGYPLVDAGMRELWQTGFMHNRVRMIAASFLIKHLRIDWRHGEAWFWDTLVDADLANNAAGWQWVAGSGAG
jgi:deoxyribodipyrimidine photo-lyase